MEARAVALRQSQFPLTDFRLGPRHVEEHPSGPEEQKEVTRRMPQAGARSNSSNDCASGNSSRLRLLRHRHDMDAPIPLPAGLIVFRAYRTLLAVADYRQLGGRDSYLDQVVLSGFGPSVAQPQVVLG